MPAWMPFREIEALRRELDRALGLEQGRSPAAPTATFLPGRSARAYPLTNLSEDKENIFVQALAPGIDPEQLDLTVLRNTLTISGTKTGPADVSAECYHRSERAAGKFVRSIELPTDVDSERVEARYVNGVLTITLPKAAAARPKQVSIAVG